VGLLGRRGEPAQSDVERGQHHGREELARHVPVAGWSSPDDPVPAVSLLPWM
jgi:hypothetical protein